jgi:hypothetical protein
MHACLDNHQQTKKLSGPTMKNSTELLKYHPSTVQIFASIKRLAASLSLQPTDRATT